MFGEEDILEESKRIYSAKCDSLDGVLYYVRTKDFFE